MPPARFRERSDTTTANVGGWPRWRADDPGLPGDVLYVVACGSDGERDLRSISESLEFPGRER